MVKCDKCFEKIEVKSEDYYKVETFEKGKKVKEGYMHKRCNDKIDSQKKQELELMNVVMPLANRVNQMLDNMGIEEKKKEYVIA